MFNMQNPVSVMAAAGKLSVAQLQQAIKDGTVPPYIGIPLLQEKTKQAQQIQQATTAQQQTRPPIAAQVMAEARGVEGLPSNIGEHAYKGGGIVAFAGPTDGSYVSGDAGMTDQELQDRLLAKKVGQSMLYPFDAIADAGAGSWNVASGLVDKGLNALGAARIGKAVGIYPPGTTSVKTPKLGDESFTPFINEREAAIANLGKSQPQVPAAKPTPTPAASPSFSADMAARRNPLLDLVQAPAKKSDNTVDTKPRKDASGNVNVKAPADTLSAVTLQRPDLSIYDTLKQPNETEDEAIARIEGKMGKGKYEDKLAASLEKMATDAETAKEKAPWLALMNAGLATMAGTSPYALTNIGAGGQKGLQNYLEAQKDYDKSQEKQMEIMSRLDQAEQAKHQAAVTAGVQSSQFNRAHNEQIALAKAKASEDYNTNVAKLEMDKANYHLNEYKAQVEAGYYNAKINLDKVLGEKAERTSQLTAIKDVYDKAADYIKFTSNNPMAKKDPMYQDAMSTMKQLGPIIASMGGATLKTNMPTGGAVLQRGANGEYNFVTPKQ